jgi:hypothetical protein
VATHLNIVYSTVASYGAKLYSPATTTMRIVLVVAIFSSSVTALDRSAMDCWHFPENIP